ncbi:hypothetical protein [uncultured Lutibacter sp.]|uniref:hypothetical protein n=1 Tax=uncultured Lutibacter sp. TaxID=437739 RepID=UPI00262266D8|nr:hypothetical protein [uncultured Lutibacter sp.]
MKNQVMAFAISLLLFSCSSTYKKEDAIRSLKVLNSDILNLLTVTTELPEIQALKFLYNQANSPIPFKKSEFKVDNSTFKMENMKGTYIWNPELNDYDFKKDKGFIDVYFQLACMENIYFQILNYESEAYSSKPDFPTKIIAKILDGTKEKLVINHVGKVKDNLPEFMETTIKGGEYDLIAGFKRTKESGDGTIDMYWCINKGLFTIIDAKILAEISYSQQGFYYNHIAFESKVFNHTIMGTIDYKNIEPTSTNYAESFNRNATIEIFESSNIKVGDIVLVSSGVDDLQEFKIQFENNEQVLLKEYLPALDKLYNLKY